MSNSDSAVDLDYIVSVLDTIRNNFNSVKDVKDLINALVIIVNDSDKVLECFNYIVKDDKNIKRLMYDVYKSIVNAMVTVTRSNVVKEGR